jgi:hypothetical protein
MSLSGAVFAGSDFEIKVIAKAISCRSTLRAGVFDAAGFLITSYWSSR